MAEQVIKIGERVRKIRNQRGLTLQDVASYTGFSKALISQIENNVVTPPINTLSKIAKVLNVKMTYFFEEEIDYNDYHIVRRNDRKLIFREGVKHGYIYEELAKVHGFENLEIYMVTIKESGSDKKLFNHEGYEYIYLKRGKINLYLNNEVIEVEEGDSIAFNSRIPHYLECPEGEAKVIGILLKTEGLKEHLEKQAK
ncbi:XRE family transcriptional regulator [Geovibrio thiophilus]|uniref:XRE family transcriptional regulator n=1 Tax=Geovibrio thiophilus TaxID=139438 RepID=A0A3R5UUV6_9BACT|nr:XRE family transcriptional regulator [Geovibrio thiophilus]QAR33210.1 XRE family transcriptional regulator [Geovibrio thiophilus]